MSLLWCMLRNHAKFMIVRYDALGSQCVRTLSLSTKHHAAKEKSVKPAFMSLYENLDFLGAKPLIIDDVGSHSYIQIFEQSFYLSLKLKNEYCITKESRVVYLCPNNVTYTIVQWAAWMTGCVAVPLCKSHPSSQLEYYIQDARPAVVIGTTDFYDVLQPVCEAQKVKSLWLQYNPQTRTFVESGKRSSPLMTELYRLYAFSWTKTNWEKKDAMLIYTSGTTAQPKGVVVTHGNMYAQVENMAEMWQWSEDDVILHVLPLHHVHGVVNCLATSLKSGATCVMLPEFDAKQVWEKLTSEKEPVVNLFMAVPTIYAKLIEYYDKKYKSPRVQEFIKSVCKENIRLMVSGSAALPTPIMKRWEEITGHVLLERYGMTEIGMALTNPLHDDRVPGMVGSPFPSVEVQIVEKDGTVVAHGDGVGGTTVTEGMEDHDGELYVKGPSVFSKYWMKKNETVNAFTDDGWFKTGDTVAYRDGMYQILGRTSVDIIKSGGYKISAFEIERHLLANKKIKECAVVGLPDPIWGESVAALVVLTEGNTLNLLELKAWAAIVLPPYKIPSVLKCVDDIPKNPMGKVNKKELKELFYEHSKMAL